MFALAARKSAFATLVANYHNSFENVAEGTISHSPKFIKQVISCLEAVDAKAALATDPRLTSTNSGAIAVGIARRVMTNEKASRAFVDIEIGESAFITTFDKDITPAQAISVLGPVGTVAQLCKFGDKIGEGMVSDILILAVEPQQAVAESILAEEKNLLTESEIGVHVIPDDLSDEEAYDHTQTTPGVRGKVLVHKGRVGFMHRAWPVQVVGKHGAWETLNPDAKDKDDELDAGIAAAKAHAAKLGIKESASGVVSVKDFKVAMRAHNAGKEVSHNDAYNAQNGLGTVAARGIVRRVASAAHGDPKGKVTLAHAKSWAHRTLPPGAGYADQDAKPEYAEVIAHLKGLSEDAVKESAIDEAKKYSSWGGRPVVSAQKAKSILATHLPGHDLPRVGYEKKLFDHEGSAVYLSNNAGEYSISDHGSVKNPIRPGVAAKLGVHESTVDEAAGDVLYTASNGYKVHHRKYATMDAIDFIPPTNDPHYRPHYTGTLHKGQVYTNQGAEHHRAGMEAAWAEYMDPKRAPVKEVWAKESYTKEKHAEWLKANTHAVVSYSEGRPFAVTENMPHAEAKKYHADASARGGDHEIVDGAKAAQIRHHMDTGESERYVDKKPPAGASVKEAHVGTIDKEVWAKAEAAAEKSYGDLRKSNPDKFYGTTMKVYKNMNGIKESAKPLFVHAFGEAAWNAIDEATRSQTVLKHMLSAFAQPTIAGPRTATGNKSFDEVFQGIMAARKAKTCLHEAAVEDAAFALFEHFGKDVRAVIESTIVTGKLDESCLATNEATADTLKLVASHLLMVEGFVPEALQDDLDAWNIFVATI